MLVLLLYEDLLLKLKLYYCEAAISVVGLMVDFSVFRVALSRASSDLIIPVGTGWARWHTTV